MPEITEEFAHALFQALCPTAAPSAIEDLANRFLRDQPRDLPNYIAVLQSQLPHAFAPPAVEPAPPAPGTRAVLADADLLAMAGAAPPAGTGSTSTPPQAPASVAADDARAFIAHLEAIAAGTTRVE
jgi:hypothetical protein